MLTTGQRLRLPARGLSRREWMRGAAALFPAAGSRAPCRAAAAAPKSPPLELKTLDGATIQLHRQPGKAVLVDFMTTTCPSCRQASEAIQALYEELGARGFLPAAIAIGLQAGDVLRMYRTRHGLTFPVGALAREDVLRYLGHPADKPLYVPILVLLDKQGRISMKRVGWVGQQELRSAVTKLLSQKS